MNTETKRHIDAARQVLVGVVPNPTSQIDQITNALIYKFMDDMDQSSIKAGGDASFFTGDLERYAWSRLIDPRIGNQERMNIYGEALTKFSEADQLPELFRNIFKSAFLPYRSPETLGLFLKEINYFDYSHPEELGNAYEYLLSIMSSQGDAGQFRTPRHIIDFIVDVVNPTKDDKVLDPACGTGGFLVSSYKHILEQHDGKDDPGKTEKPLTPDERKRMMGNFEGYDIDPSMVRIAQVNMYLHQFKNPKIFQYDSLSSDEKWNEKFDVILANPPFMSPKGGIKPHSKFSIPSSRSEVLFVDYIMNHLRPKGRAGIIVPEGIIFQSGSAYKQLRKNLVEDGLYAVVSLPSGVFQPYSGVKTSILLFNNELAKQSKDILFVKVTNDGFDLGAQRRSIEKNDLPIATNIITEYQKMIRMGNGSIGNIQDFKKHFDFGHSAVSIIAKEKISNDGDYNLSGDRYGIAADYTVTKWPMVTLGEVIRLDFGERITKNSKMGTKYPVYGGGGESFRTDEFNRENEYVIARFAMSNRCVRFVTGQFWMMDSGGTFSIKPEYQDRLNKNFVGKFLLSCQENIFMCARGGAQKNLNNDHFYELKIPLPPLEIQEQIVAELDGYTGIIAGAKQIVQNWKPKIDIDPKWEKVKLKEISDKVTKGTTPTTNGFAFQESGINFIKIESIDDGGHFIKEKFAHINQECNESLKRSQLKENDVLFSIAGALGRVALVDSSILPANTNQALAIISPKSELDPKYLEQVLRSNLIQDQIFGLKVGVAQSNLSLAQISNFEIPFPPLATQKQIVEKIEAERALVEASKKLIEIYEQKTKEVIGKLWEE
jgi:type I restriction enzyme M protein